MEMIMVSDRKLKVMLSAEDLAEFDIDSDKLDYTNTETKHLFWEILAQAKQALGFNTDGHRVLVQLFPSRKGGCEIFITKLENALASPDQEPQLHYKPSHRSSASDSREGVYRFDSMERLLAVCRRLGDIGYTKDSSAFLGDDRSYYLFLGGMDRSDYLTIDEFSFLEEYGNAESADRIRHFLCEHGKEICPHDAVRILGSL